MKKKALLISCLVAATLTMAQSLPSYVPDSGIVAWWPFNGNANDESGKGNNGTVYGATLSNDRSAKPNKAYNFTSDSIKIANTANFNLNQFTVSGWFKTTSAANSDYHTLLNHSSGVAGSGIYDGYWIGVFEGRVNLFLGSGSSGIDITAYNKTVNDGTWHFLTGVYNGTVGSVYVDGVLEKSSNFTMAFKSEETMIGNNYLKEDFAGDLDDIGVWNRALTQLEITNLYSGGSAGTKATNLPYAISIWPNPAKDCITIDVDKSVNLTGCELKIYTAFGQEVYKSECVNQLSTYSIGHLPNGVYFFKVMNEDQIIASQKIIKQ